MRGIERWRVPSLHKLIAAISVIYDRQRCAHLIHPLVLDHYLQRERILSACVTAPMGPSRDCRTGATQMKLSRERYIPQGATKIADKQSDAVAYIYTNASQRPCARVFFGKQTKPVVHCYYRSEAERERAVILAFQGRR